MWIEIVFCSPISVRIVSQPAKAVWIEIPCLSRLWSGRYRSQPAKAVWIEIREAGGRSKYERSQPAKAVWIEMAAIIYRNTVYLVTACEGCVD